MHAENSKRGSISRGTVRTTTSSHPSKGDSPEGARAGIQGGKFKGIFSLARVFVLILIKLI